MTGYEKILDDLTDRRNTMIKCAKETKIKLEKDLNPFRRYERKRFIKECKNHADIIGLCIDVVKMNMEKGES